MKRPKRFALLLFTITSLTSSILNGQNRNDLKTQTKKIELSNDSERYIQSVIDVMKKNAVHRRDLNFDSIQQVIRQYANGAQKPEDTHQAIKKALPLLKDHHSAFMTSAEIKQNLGFDEKDIAEIKKGRAPHIHSSMLDSLKKHLQYATGTIMDDNVAYLSIPSFNNLYSEGMVMFADSLHAIIRELDQHNVRGWIVDLRDNNGGAAMPMIAGLGPLLNHDNVFFTVDKEGQILSKSYYKNGGYYDVNANEQEMAPLVQVSTIYALNSSNSPVAVLTSFRTASSAEAVAAIFAGQANVKIIGKKTAGLTSTNSFHFLEDNSAINLTIGYYANRHLEMYKQGIAPDIEVGLRNSPKSGSSDDIQLQKALLWISDF